MIVNRATIKVIVIAIRAVDRFIARVIIKENTTPITDVTYKSRVLKLPKGSLIDCSGTVLLSIFSPISDCLILF